MLFLLIIHLFFFKMSASIVITLSCSLTYVVHFFPVEHHAEEYAKYRKTLTSLLILFRLIAFSPIITNFLFLDVISFCVFRTPLKLSKAADKRKSRSGESGNGNKLLCDLATAINWRSCWCFQCGLQTLSR